MAVFIFKTKVRLTTLKLIKTIIDNTRPERNELKL